MTPESPVLLRTPDYAVVPAFFRFRGAGSPAAFRYSLRTFALKAFRASSSLNRTIS